MPPRCALCEPRDMLSVLPQTRNAEGGEDLTQSQHLYCLCPPTTVFCRPSSLWYDMLDLHVFVVLIKASHVDMVVSPIFKFPLSKASNVSVPSTHFKQSPHNVLCRIRGQELIAFMDNTDFSRSGCVKLCLGSFKRLSLVR